MGSLEKIDFNKYGIFDFSPEEIAKTGARLEDVRLVLFVCLQNFRTALRQNISLLFNGLTTGFHVSPEHPRGEAVDFIISGDIDIRRVVVLLIRAGFNGIGVYWNGQIYSFHADLRSVERFAIWTGVKDKPGAGPWQMKTIVGNTINTFDPREV